MRVVCDLNIFCHALPLITATQTWTRGNLLADVCAYFVLRDHSAKQQEVDTIKQLENAFSDEIEFRNYIVLQYILRRTNFIHYIYEHMTKIMNRQN